MCCHCVQYFVTLWQATMMKKETKELLQELKVRGEKDKLLMFLTGPTGTGNITAVKAAR